MILKVILKIMVLWSGFRIGNQILLLIWLMILRGMFSEFEITTMFGKYLAECFISRNLFRSLKVEIL